MTQIDYKLLKNGGFMRQRQNDMFAMRLRIVGGFVTADQLTALADAAKKYGDGTIHLTARQGIEIPHVHIDNVDKIKAELEDNANIQHGVCGPRVRTVVACQGTRVCPRGLIDAQGIAEKIDEKYYANAVPHKFKFAVTGCPASCLKPQENDFGIGGGILPAYIEEKCVGCGLCEEICPTDAIKVENGKVIFTREECILCGDCISSCPTDAWEEGEIGCTIYVGGKVGRFPLLGFNIAELVKEDKLYDMIDKTLDFYRKEGKTGERFGSTIQRVGLEKLKEAVL